MVMLASIEFISGKTHLNYVSRHLALDFGMFNTQCYFVHSMKGKQMIPTSTCDEGKGIMPHSDIAIAPMGRICGYYIHCTEHSSAALDTIPKH
jgi:hypothetical protein